MWNSGVMLLRPTAATIRLMDRWVAWCRRRPAEWDQLNLQAADKNTLAYFVNKLRPGI